MGATVVHAVAMTAAGPGVHAAATATARIRGRPVAREVMARVLSAAHTSATRVPRAPCNATPLLAGGRTAAVPAGRRPRKARSAVASVELAHKSTRRQARLMQLLGQPQVGAAQRQEV